ncbi:MAG: hypothetical protein ACO2PO_20735 [Candidatus Calescibacterium sp.]|jgi:hypothetical protein
MASSFIDNFIVIVVDISDISNFMFYDESSDRFVDRYWILIINADIGDGKRVILYAISF